MKSKEYKALKNLIHNELKITKEDLLVIISDVIKDEARAHTRRIMAQDMNLTKQVKEHLFKEITSAITGRSYDRARDEFFKKVGEEVIKQLNITLNEN